MGQIQDSKFMIQIEMLKSVLHHGSSLAGNTLRKIEDCDPKIQSQSSPKIEDCDRFRSPRLKIEDCEKAIAVLVAVLIAVLIAVLDF